MNSIQIRPALENDLPVILAFIRELAEYEKLSHEYNPDAERMRNDLFGDRPAAEVLIAEWNGAPAGFALFFQNYSTFLGKPGLYLEDLFVRPEFRGKGIGNALLVRLAKIARDRDYGRMEWSVLDWNEPAIAFYKGLGAVPIDEWTVYRLTDEAIAQLASGR
jgi:GNAT superfamily N-acetyltransferase